MLIGTIVYEIDVTRQYLKQAYTICDDLSDIPELSNLVDDAIRKLSFLQMQLEKIDQSLVVGNNTYS